MDPTNLTAVGDQYSLGCVMYFCLTGQYPFPDGTAVEKMMAHQHKQPKSIQELAPDMPDGLAAVVERLMQKTPAWRYASCAEVIEALRPFAPVSGPVRSRPTMTIPRLKPSASAAPCAEIGGRPGSRHVAADRPIASARPIRGGPETKALRPGSSDARTADGSRSRVEARPGGGALGGGAGIDARAEIARPAHGRARLRPAGAANRRRGLAGVQPRPAEVTAVFS